MNHNFIIILFFSFLIFSCKPNIKSISKNNHQLFWNKSIDDTIAKKSINLIDSLLNIEGYKSIRNVSKMKILKTNDGMYELYFAIKKDENPMRDRTLFYNNIGSDLSREILNSRLIDIFLSDNDFNILDSIKSGSPEMIAGGLKTATGGIIRFFDPINMEMTVDGFRNLAPLYDYIYLNDPTSEIEFSKLNDTITIDIPYNKINFDSLNEDFNMTIRFLTDSIFHQPSVFRLIDENNRIIKVYGR